MVDDKMYKLCEKWLRSRHTDIIERSFNEYYSHTDNVDTGATKLYYHYLFSRFCKELHISLGLDPDETGLVIRKYFKNYNVMDALYEQYGYGDY